MKILCQAQWIYSCSLCIRATVVSVLRQMSMTSIGSRSVKLPISTSVIVFDMFRRRRGLLRSCGRNAPSSPPAAAVPVGSERKEGANELTFQSFQRDTRARSAPTDGPPPVNVTLIEMLQASHHPAAGLCLSFAIDITG